MADSELMWRFTPPVRKPSFISWSLVLLSVFWLTWGCSTEKNAAINRGYHNMTARFNGYFNAGEIIKESLKEFRFTYAEDYTRILPVYIYPSAENVSTLYPEMDRAIDKTSVVIKKHSMPNPDKSRKEKKEEWCKWIDDNWLVMGQAHFYKREFEAAIEKFDYIYKTYRELEIRYDALLWQAKAYMEAGRMNEAQRVLDRLMNDCEEVEAEKKEKKEKKEKPTRSKNKAARKAPKKAKVRTPSGKPDARFPLRLKRDLFTTHADFYLRRENYEKAIEKLPEAIKLTRKKRDRARLTFILAQVYQKRGNYDLASENYAKIPKLNPTFEMEFYSRINRALLFQGGDSRGIRRELIKLLKDEKNKEFFDQIYYALAEVELREERRQEGVDYLQKSIETSVSNDRQKGKSYLRLGDLSFSDRSYVPAKSYYDSSLTFLPQDYPAYREIQSRSASLTELVEHLTEFHLQDSLYKLSQLSRKEQERIINETIRREREEEERKRAIEEAKQFQLPGTIAANSGGQGGWYFYNQQTKAFGITDFRKVWGNRKLEDDWRRSNKTTSPEFDEGNLVAGETVVQDESAADEAKREAYLESIPRGPEALIICREKIMDALYYSGVIYKDKLQQPDLAIQSFLELLKRFEEGAQVLPTHYQLYLLYVGKPEAETYKSTVLNKYPDSEYAQLILNPNFKKDAEQAKAVEEKFYIDTYRLYLNKKYSESLTASTQVINSEPRNHFLSKYYFLRALSYGQMGQIENFEYALAECVEKYPKDDVGKEASEMLDYLRNRKSIESAKQGGFLYEADAQHFFVLVFPNRLGSITTAKARFSDFHTKYFNGKGLSITNNFIDGDNQLIVVKSFAGKQLAMEYYQAFLNENELLKDYKDTDFFPISSKNYATFFLEKKVDDYKQFFRDNYR